MKEKEWQEMYERNREKFRCKIDLESYFKEKKGIDNNESKK